MEHKVAKEHESELIQGRKLVLPERLNAKDVNSLVHHCQVCDELFLICPSCNNDPNSKSVNPCHHYRIVFVDGSCLNNGKPNAAAGIAAVSGMSADSQQSLPINEDTNIDPDPDAPKTSQRAELLAALLGLQWPAFRDSKYPPSKCEDATANLKGSHSKKPLVIATDSEYVVKGMTEWLPRWKENKFLTSENKKPVNLDLFLILDSLVDKEAEGRGVEAGFWHIGRDFNVLADRLAKSAAMKGDKALQATGFRGDLVFGW